MAELKARIKHKNGTPDEWSQATNFSPLKGELVVYNDATNPRVKIGDGETNVNDLPFINNAFVTVNLDGAGDGEDFVPDDNLVINAETLGGKPASSYMLKTDTATNSSKLGGKDPEYYLSPWLTGTVEEIAPIQVYQALMNQQNVMLTYPSTSFGPITFTKFSFMTNGPSTIVIANDFLLAKQFYLAGQIQSNEWHLYEESQFVTQNEYLSLDEHVEKNFYKKYDVYNKNEIDTLITNANVQGNWDQNDSSAKDYIQNRTHWRTPMTPVTFTESISIYGHDSEWSSWNGMEGILYRGDWSETYITLPDNLTLRSGQTLTFQIGDATYSGTLEKESWEGGFLFKIGDDTLCEWGNDWSVLELPITHDYYIDISEITYSDGTVGQTLCAYFDPSLGYAGNSYNVVITISGYDYYPIDINYMPKEVITTDTALTLNKVYPVGSIYLSTSSQSPASLFGGTWTQLKDRFLLGAGSTYTAGRTAGVATHTHTTGDHTLTIDEMPSHGHYIMERQQWYAADEVVNAATGSIYSWKSGTGGTTSATYKSDYRDISYEGGGAAHNHGNTGSSTNLPPYLVVYMWKRVS